MDDERVQC